MRNELSRLLGVTLVVFLPLAGCVGKEDTQPTITPGPTPASCEGVYEGMPYSVQNNTTLTQPFPDQILGAWEVYDRQIEFQCGAGGQLQDVLTTSQMRLYRTPTPTSVLDSTPTSSATREPTETTTSTAASSPSKTPTRIPIPTDTPKDLPPDCTRLRDAGWVDHTNDLGGDCQESTYYTICGEPDNPRCMFDQKGQADSAASVVIPYGPDTSLTCGDGSVIHGLEPSSAGTACIWMYDQQRGAVPDPLTPESEEVVNCVLPPMQQQFMDKGIGSIVAINMTGCADLGELGLGQVGQCGVVCSIAPQKQ